MFLNPIGRGGPARTFSIEYLIVGSGGSGAAGLIPGNDNRGSGGSAGQVLQGNFLGGASGTLQITIDNPGGATFGPAGTGTPGGPASVVGSGSYSSVNLIAAGGAAGTGYREFGTGADITSSISGTSQRYAVPGPPSNNTNFPPPPPFLGSGGMGGSGLGGNNPVSASGTKGVVILRYLDIYPVASFSPPSAATYTNTGGFRIYQFTSTGQLIF